MRLTVPELLFIPGLLAYVVIRGVYETRAKHWSAVTRRVAARDQLLIPLVGIGGIILPILYLSTEWLSFANYRTPQLLSWIGVGAMLTALFLFWRSHADLGTNWSRTLEMRERHELVTRGVYRFVRHPMYAAIWVFSLAQGLILQNWLAGCAAVVAFGSMYFLRVNREEQMMRDEFGDAYAEYCKHTGRVIPRIRR